MNNVQLCVVLATQRPRELGEKITETDENLFFIKFPVLPVLEYCSSFCQRDTNQSHLGGGICS